jgi:hypothetical protein
MSRLPFKAPLGREKQAIIYTQWENHAFIHGITTIKKSEFTSMPLNDKIRISFASKQIGIVSIEFDIKYTVVS